MAYSIDPFVDNIFRLEEVTRYVVLQSPFVYLSLLNSFRQVMFIMSKFLGTSFSLSIRSSLHVSSWKAEALVHLIDLIHLS